MDGLGEADEEDRVGTVLRIVDAVNAIERQGVRRVEVNDIGVVEVASEIVADLHLLVVRFEEAEEHAADNETAALFGGRVSDGDCDALIPDADHLSLFHVVVEREVNLQLERLRSVDLVAVERLGLVGFHCVSFRDRSKRGTSEKVPRPLWQIDCCAAVSPRFLLKRIIGRFQLFCGDLRSQPVFYLRF